MSTPLSIPQRCSRGWRRARQYLVNPFPRNFLVLRALTSLWGLSGTFTDDGSSMLQWMGSISNDTPIEMINIPGTHDACACMYSFAEETIALIRTSVVQGIIRAPILKPPSHRYMHPGCQCWILTDQVRKSLPIFDQLHAGMRFLDIRFGINNGTVMVYHGVLSFFLQNIKWLINYLVRGRLAQ